MVLDVAVALDMAVVVTVAVDFVVIIILGTVVFIPTRLSLTATTPERGRTPRFCSVYTRLPPLSFPSFRSLTTTVFPITSRQTTRSLSSPTDKPYPPSLHHHPSLFLLHTPRHERPIPSTIHTRGTSHAGLRPAVDLGNLAIGKNTVENRYG